MKTRPLALDLCSGLGGWAEGLEAEGWDVIRVDIVDMFAQASVPKPSRCLLILQDIRTFHGSQARRCDLIVASPPCTEFSWMAMPWSRAKQIGRALRGEGEFPASYKGSRTITELNCLFDACFRIQREAIEAAGHHIPLIVENVRGAQPWVGRARWNFGSFYLWGDVPALMPVTLAKRMKSQISCAPRMFSDRVASTPEEAHALHYRLPDAAIKNNGGSWFNVAHNTTSGKGQNPDGRKGIGPTWDPATQSGSYGVKRWTNPSEGVKQNGSGAAWWDKALDERRREATAIKNGGDWFASGEDCSPQRRASSGSTSRKFASAMIAKIPLQLSRHIGATFYPKTISAPSGD